MEEERIDMAMQLGQPNSSNLKEWTKSMLGFQNNVIQQQREKSNLESDRQLQNLYTTSVSTANHGIAQECNTATRIGLVARGIRDWYNSNGITEYDTWGDGELVDAYKEAYPEYEEDIWNFVLDGSQICDPNDLYERLGFYNSKGADAGGDSAKSTFIQNVVGGAGDAASGLGEFVGDSLADAVGWTAKQLGADEEETNRLVGSFKSYLEENTPSSSIGSNTDSLTYMGTKILTEFMEAIGLGAALEGGVENRAGGPLVGPKTPFLPKTLVNSAEGAVDMGIFDIISEGELPDGWDLSAGAILGALSPYLGTFIKGGVNFGKKIGKYVKGVPNKIANEQFERTLRKLVKLTEKKEMDFYKEFGQTYIDFMKERNLKTYDDLVKYFADTRYTKRKALSSIKGKFKSAELDDVLNSSVDYAAETSDKKNLTWLKEYQRKNIEDGGLTLSEADEVREYFAYKKRFNFNEGTSTKEIDTNTNMYENFIDWERKVAKENGLENLADLNNDIKAGYILKKELRDLTKVGKKGASFYDFFVAASTGDITKATSYLFSTALRESPQANLYYAKILEKMFKDLKAGRTVDTLVDFEKIQNIQSEKELMQWFQENGIKYEQLGYNGGAVNDAGKTILQPGKDTIISTPSGDSFIEGDIIELPQTNMQ